MNINFMEIFAGFGFLWWLATVAACLAVARQLLGIGFVSVLAVFANCVVAFLFVGGVLWPGYVKTWDPELFVYGAHWAVPMLTWMYAAMHAPVDWVGGGTFGGK